MAALRLPSGSILGDHLWQGLGTKGLAQLKPGQSTGFPGPPAVVAPALSDQGDPVCWIPRAAVAVRYQLLLFTARRKAAEVGG